MSDSPTGTVTFLLSDIVESTTLWQADPVQMDVAMRAHDRIMRAVIGRRDGTIVKHTGDGVVAAFHRASSAAQAALDCRHTLGNVPWPSHTPLEVRIVLHTGECFERDHDYFGSPLCVAKRLIELTPPGSVWVTEITATLLTNVRIDRFEAIPLGTRRLRGVSEPIGVFHLVRPRADIVDVVQETA